ncbi:adenylate/guanylate cyclase catalytic domain protein [Leptospira inadai serovar Lyme str. 10]|uniref:Adenylate/guanylate cyclase catalytic domain protein n=1 Tax=Leptospira inadai serovar Lyme str. 10 TaxID=1049790 RepID=V6HME0_9LEPT|nr:adenylate/guanylate cyclase catalytic domain protein [Leptospira inadai serovar Lyme str. 10]
MLENELEDKRWKIERLLQNMQKYLPMKLYERVTDGELSISSGYQRKKLTVFFSDLVGFTELTDSVEPEVIASCLNCYMNDMSRLAVKYGGKIDKFIGDAMMIFFEESDSDSGKAYALNCIHMALEMQKRLRLIRLAWKEFGISESVQVRIGINTGFCTMGNFGSDIRMDYTIIGNTVNVAARLEQLARPGSILISVSTYELIKDEFRARSLGKVQIKGIHVPVEIFELIGTRENKISPYLEKNGDTFKLKEIIMPLKSPISDQEALSIMEALEETRDTIEKSLRGWAQIE